jgi:flagellar export protein FliJ
MGSPKFSLQNVLDIRHGKVELLEIELGKLLAMHQETQNLLNALGLYQESLLNQLSAAQTGEIDLVNLNLLRLNALQLNRHIEMVTIEFKKQFKVIKDKRVEIVQAKQSEETLEILKRKRHEVYAAEQVQIEAQIQDDIYIARAFRNQQQGA